MRTILIVDDSPLVAYGVSASFSDDYIVGVALSGEEALALVATKKPDLVLLDVEMPGMDGYEVCRRLKSNPDTSNIPIIFLTAHTSPESEAAGFKVGAADYIHKPFLPALMLARVNIQLALVDALDQAEKRQIQLLNIERERNNNQQELLTRRLEHVMNATGQGIWDFNVKTGVVSHNRQWCTLLGLDDHYLEHPVEKFVAIVHEADRATVMKTIEAALNGDGNYKSEHRMLRSDGTAIWVEDRGQVVERDEQGAPIRMVGSIVDLSERKQREETMQQLMAELKSLNERFLIAKESAQIGVWELLLPENRIEWDERMYTLFGFTKDEFAGQYELAINRIHPDDREKVEDEKERALKGDNIFDTEFRVVLPTGAIRHIKACAIVHRDAQGRPTRMVGVNYDITERKMIELAATQAAHAKSAFLANMSHEIRTPMNGIIGMTHLVLQGDLSQEQREHMLVVNNSAKRLLGIINDILDFSKIEAGKLVLETVEFDLEQLMTEAVETVRPVAEAKGLEISVFFDVQKQVRLIGDPLRISQILLNYLNNAIKFTESGRIEVDVTLNTLTGNKAALEVSVIDTGIGLTESQKARLFQSFEQADQSTTRKYGGSGLGLSISKQLAEMMGGQVGVESQVGTGSTFWFVVTVDVLGNQGQERLFTKQPDLKHADFSLIKGTRVLLAEDDQTNQLVAVGLLKAAGLSVDVANNGDEAVNRLLSNPNYEIVLMDMQMPVVDGLQATRMIRAHKQFDRLPIVAMTANAMQMHQHACIEAGMNDFVSKPFEPNQLYATIHKWVAGTGAMASSGLPATEDESPDAHIPVNVPGLDIRDGLRRVIGMKDVYVMALQCFAEQQADFADRINAALGRNDLNVAIRDTHTLKGVAGTIGAQDLMDLAIKLEVALMKNDQAAASELLEVLQRGLDPIVLAIRERV